MKKFVLSLLAVAAVSVFASASVVVQYATFTNPQGHQVTSWRKICPTGTWEYIKFDASTNIWWHPFNPCEFSVGNDSKTNFYNIDYNTAVAFATNNSPGSIEIVNDCNQ